MTNLFLPLPFLCNDTNLESLKPESLALVSLCDVIYSEASDLFLPVSL